MNFNTYQKEGRKTWISDCNVGFIRSILGLVGESGEVAETVKKSLRGDYHLTTDDIKKELGDVLYYICRVADYYNLTLEEIAESNIEKLLDRQKRGKLKGSGDSR